MNEFLVCVCGMGVYVCVVHRGVCECVVCTRMSA